jgi:hypothetical protein
MNGALLRIHLAVSRELNHRRVLTCREEFITVVDHWSRRFPVRQSRLPVAIPLFCSLCLLTVTSTAPRAQSRPASARGEQVGNVNFPTSCSPQVQVTLDQALALLHSFQYQEAEQVFTLSSQQDAACAMAYWGKAMALYHQLWDFPNAKNLAEGRRDIEQAQKLGAKTGRERDYVSAAVAFYQDDPKLSHMARLEAYSAAMEKLYHDNPEDNEAGEFYALSLISIAQMDQQDLANCNKAIAILNPIFAEYPNNPGAAHYLIHASDTPELALQGLPAARAYAKIAPDSAHALHMPSHIFRRLGLWQEVIDSNIVSAAAAAKATKAHTGDPSYQFHAMEFLEYAYLQSGQETKARDLVREVKHVPGTSKGDIIDQQNLFGARNALELHRWKEAASLAIPNERFDWQDITYWTRTIGAARSGDVAGARANVQKLSETIQARDASQRIKGTIVAPGESVDQLEAEGWLAYAEGKPAEAVTKLRSAADSEEAKHSDPFATPAREMLADLLLELKRPAEASVEYESVSKSYPNRFDALYGSAQVAQSLGDRAKASQYYAKLLAISAPSADRPELRDAREYAAANNN